MTETSYLYDFITICCYSFCVLVATVINTLLFLTYKILKEVVAIVVLVASLLLIYIKSSVPNLKVKLYCRYKIKTEI